MLSEINTNNKINYEINVKKEEKKYSWSTVFAWLYLKTIGRILPKRWNKWAENILYYDKATGNNGVQTDDLKTTDESAKIDLKPEVAEKENQSGVISKDGEGQTDRVTFRDITMQTECVETTDKNIEVNLESERERELKDENEELKRQLEGVNQALKTFIGLCNDQAQQIADLQLGNGFLEEKNGELRSKLAELEKNYRELAEVADKRGEEFLAKFKEKSETIVRLEGELIKLSTEFANKAERLSVEAKEKDTKINSLTRLNEGLDEGKKTMEAKNEDLQVQVTELEGKVSRLKGKIDAKTAEVNRLKGQLTTQLAEMGELKKQLQNTQKSEQQLEFNLESKVSELQKEKVQYEEQLKAMEKECKTYEESQRNLESKLEDLRSRLSTAEEEKKRSEDEVAELQKQVRILEESKEWELAGIDDSLKKVFLDVIGMLEKQLLINNQEQQLQEKKVDLIERLKAELKKESDEALQETREKIAEQEKLIEQLKKEQKQVESQLEADIKKLQVALSSIQAYSETLGKNYELKIQQVENSTAEHGQQKVGEELDEKTKRSQEQTKAQEPDTMSVRSIVPTAKSTTSSMKSTQSKFPKILNLKDKNLNSFLSDKNKELKNSFPEFEKKHFCHNVYGETIKSLSNKNDGKFKSSELLELLEANLKKSAKEIIEIKVREVVTNNSNYYKIGKNIDKELRDDTLKTKLLSSVQKCIEKLEFRKKDVVATKNSILCNFNGRNNNNNDSRKLLKEIVVEELVEARMRFFSSKVQELELASSIRDKFLSPDQKVCNQIQEEGNEYQLTEKAKKEYTSNSSMTRTSSTASIPSLSNRRAVGHR